MVRGFPVWAWIDAAAAPARIRMAWRRVAVARMTCIETIPEQKQRQPRNRLRAAATAVALGLGRWKPVMRSQPGGNAPLPDDTKRARKNRRAEYTSSPALRLTREVMLQRQQVIQRQPVPLPKIRNISVNAPGRVRRSLLSSARSGRHSQGICVSRNKSRTAVFRKHPLPTPRREI